MMAQWVGGEQEFVTPLPLAPAANSNAYGDRYGVGVGDERLNIRSALLGLYTGVGMVCAAQFFAGQQGFLAPTVGAAVALTITRYL